MSAAISVSALEVRRGDIVALRNLDLTVPAGTSLAVIGPNGSGKSTLLETVTGILEPHSGTTKVHGSPPALVPQSTHVDRSLPITARETVALARYATLGVFKRFKDADRQAIDRSLWRLEVDHLADRQLHELSGGQRQRVLVAQGLAQEADVLLLDEPVIGLDIASHRVILDVLDEEVHDGRTVVITRRSAPQRSGASSRHLAGRTRHPSRSTHRRQPSHGVRWPLRAGRRRIDPR